MGDGGVVIQPGTVLKVTPLRARDLEARKLAVPTFDVPTVDKLKTAGVADKSTPRPTVTMPPLGSSTGEASPALSSPPALPRAKRRYTRRKAKPES